MSNTDAPEIVWVNECDHTQCVTEYAVTGIPYRRDDLFVELEGKYHLIAGDKINLRAKLDAMEAQRDELLEALYCARPYVPDHHGPISHRIDAALTKAKGTK